MPIYHYIYVEKEKDKKEAMEVKPKSADMDILDEEEEKFLSAIPVDDSFLGDMDLQPKDAEVVCCFCFVQILLFCFKPNKQIRIGTCFLFHISGLRTKS